MSAKATEFLRATRPWLLTKASAADIGLEFALNRKGQRLTSNDIEMREQLRLRLREENTRGR